MHVYLLGVAAAVGRGLPADAELGQLLLAALDAPKAVVFGLRGGARQGHVLYKPPDASEELI